LGCIAAELTLYSFNGGHYKKMYSCAVSKTKAQPAPLCQPLPIRKKFRLESGGIGELIKFIKIHGGVLNDLIPVSFLFSTINRASRVN
jgi:hypothetical protein